jgi:hypothetical protein
MVNLSLTTKIGFGCAKIAYQIDDENVILCSKNNNTKETHIQTEFQMIRYLESFGLPIIKNIQIVPISDIMTTSSSSIGLLQKYIKNSQLLKLNSFPPVKFSEHILPHLIETYSILSTHRIFIDDFQMLYNDKEIYIIDPSNVYHLDDLTHIGHYKRRNFYDYIVVKYITQMRNLKKLLDFNQTS